MNGSELLSGLNTVKWQHSAEREVTERDRADSGVYRNRYEHTVAILLLRAPLACSDNDWPYHQNENKRMLKMRDIKQRERKQHHQHAGMETARIESAAQKCKGGNCEKRKQRYKVAGGGKCES